MKGIIGIGNILFGDDGFGPIVVEHIRENYDLPPDIEVIDAGTSLDFLLNEFMDKDAGRLIIIDVFDNGKTPGKLSVISTDELPEVYPQRLSHYMPVADLLKEIAEFKDIDIKVITCQPERITLPNVHVGLSNPVKYAVPKAGELAVRMIKRGDMNG